MNRKERALDYFRRNFNCAQSVLASFAGDYGLDEKTAMKLSCGFGAGMGRLQETCGAVTGAIMVLGLKYGKFEEKDEPARETTYQMVRNFCMMFRAVQGTTCCADLLGCDLKTQDGHEHFKAHNLRVSVCEKCIEQAVDILEEIL